MSSTEEDAEGEVEEEEEGQWVISRSSRVGRLAAGMDMDDDDDEDEEEDEEEEDDDDTQVRYVIIIQYSKSNQTN